MCFGRVRGHSSAREGRPARRSCGACPLSSHSQVQTGLLLHRQPRAGPERATPRHHGHLCSLRRSQGCAEQPQRAVGTVDRVTGWRRRPGCADVALTLVLTERICTWCGGWHSLLQGPLGWAGWEAPLGEEGRQAVGRARAWSLLCPQVSCHHEGDMQQAGSPRVGAALGVWATVPVLVDQDQREGWGSGGPVCL